MAGKHLDDVELKGIKSHATVDIRPLSPVEEDQRETDSSSVIEEEEFTPHYTSGIPFAFIIIGLCLTVFVVHLDANIIATAIPKITSTFNSLNDVGWYGSSYLLTSTALQPCFGKIYAHFDIKIVYLTSVLIFEAGSVICATAKNSPMFIVGRAIAGLGVAALFSGSMTILAFSIPLEKRPLYIGVLSSMYGLSAVAGPLLGGVLTDRLSWRWCFWINLPCGAVTFFTIACFFRSPHRPNKHFKFWKKLNQVDILGTILFIGTSVCLLLALQWGGTTYAWKNSRIWGLFLGSALIFILFVIWQKMRGASSLIPLHLLMQRSVLASAGASLFNGMTLATYVFYLPIYFQAVKHTTAEGSGVHILPLIVSLTLAAVLAGLFITATGHYVPCLWVGNVIMIVGCGMLSTLDVDSPLSHWLGYQIILGAGTGLGSQVPFLSIQVELKPADTPLGLSIIMVGNSLGGAVAISLAQSVFVNSLVKNIIRYAPGLNPNTITQTGITDIPKLGLPPAVLESITQAFARAVQSTFIPPIAFTGLCALVGLFIERRNVKGRSLTSGMA
ncbi:MFS general substrate transporter [Gymnopus androsaceus JB14]|uniref:MFS general substrate transporter n=1 Tax=Gymnopus androsaceus JB14 TaxID=1447944 RepID=A0A6A4H3E8_9AGAR|nr:MFS general substrate transporter [Gymnopus androsaceus JB14]